METCVNCHRDRRGRTYICQLGVAGSSATSTGYGYLETTTNYRILGPNSAFVCDECARRELLLRYVVPLLVCLAVEGVLLDGVPFGVVRLPASVLTVLAAVALALCVALSRRTRDVLLLPPARRYGHVGCLTLLVTLVAMLVWVIGTGGPLLLLMRVNELDSGEHSMLDHTCALSASAAVDVWIVAIVAGAQLVLLLALLAARTVLVETMVWRVCKPHLRRELGEPRLMGFNSSQYGRMSRPAQPA
jgi:hypothetical protein